MARLAGMSHPGSASNAMRAIRRKLDARVPGGAAASSNGNSAPNTPKKTPRSAASKKRNAAEMAVGGFLEDDEEDVKPSVDSPSRKKGKGKATTQAKPAARSAVVGDDDDDDDDGAVRVKRERTEEEHDVIEDDGAEEGEFRCDSHLILACLLTCSFFAQSQTSRKSESGQSHPSLRNGSSWNMSWIRFWSGYSEIYLIRCCTDADDSRSCSIGLSN